MSFRCSNRFHTICLSAMVQHNSEQIFAFDYGIIWPLKICFEFSKGTLVNCNRVSHDGINKIHFIGKTKVVNFGYIIRAPVYWPMSEYDLNKCNIRHQLKLHQMSMWNMWNPFGKDNGKYFLSKMKWCNFDFENVNGKTICKL